MRKKSKLTLALAVCSVSAAFAGLALSNTTIQVNAAEETAVFAMEKGAGVRAMKDEAGIRWTTNVTEAWVTANIPADAENVTYGTFVTSVNNVTVDGKIDVEKLTATTAEVQDLPCDVQPSYTNGTFTYYSAITYDLTGDDWTDELKKQAYATELIARSYVKYKANDSDTYTYAYAEANDTARCMRVVALAAYEETDETKKLTEAQKGYVRGYFGDEYAANFGGYYETAVGSEDATFTTKDGQDSAYTAAYYQFAELASEAADGKISIDGLTEGETYAVTLFDDNGNYAKTEFQYITALLNQGNFATYMNVQGTSTTDLKVIEGYYVLAGGIDLGSTCYGKFNKFAGTLDGNGNKISGITLTTNGTAGLFYALNGTVKNVSVDSGLRKNCGLIAYCCSGGDKAVIEDVYVKVNLSGASTGSILRYVYDGADVTVKNVVIYRTDAATANGGGVFAAVKTAKDVKMEDCYYIATTGCNPLTATANGYICMADSGDETLFGEKHEDTENGVTTYTKGNGTVTLTAYYGTSATNAKTAFDAAVATEDVTLSDEVKAMMYPTNNG